MATKKKATDTEKTKTPVFVPTAENKQKVQERKSKSSLTFFRSASKRLFQN